jgi:hypothetical protein
MNQFSMMMKIHSVVLWIMEMFSLVGLKDYIAYIYRVKV